MKEIFNEIKEKVVGVVRNERILIKSYQEELNEGEIEYVVKKREKVRRKMGMLGNGKKEENRIVIEGGGNIGI